MGHRDRSKEREKMNFIKKIPGWFTILVMLMLMTTLPAIGEEPVITAKKAADVNGTVITMMTLNNEYRQLLKYQGVEEANVSDEEAVVLKKQILESLINQELLFQECQKNRIAADEQSVAASLSELKAEFESDDEYKQALKDANMQEEEWVNYIRKSMAINELVATQITQHVTVTEEESKAYYDSSPDEFARTEKVRASHILVLVAQDAGEAKKVAAREELVGIQKKIQAGEDFATIAKESSDCPSAQNGGDLGYFERGNKVQAFEDAAFSMNIGDVSDIVETQYGYHLIKVTDKIEAGIIAYEAVRSDLEEFMTQQKISAGVASLIETIRKGAEITTYL